MYDLIHAASTLWIASKNTLPRKLLGSLDVNDTHKKQTLQFLHIAHRHAYSALVYTGQVTLVSEAII